MVKKASILLLTLSLLKSPKVLSNIDKIHQPIIITHNILNIIIFPPTPNLIISQRFIGKWRQKPPLYFVLLVVLSDSNPGLKACITKRAKVWVS